MKLRGRIVGLVALCAIAGTGIGIGAPVAFAATPAPTDFTGTYKIFYRFGDSGPFSHGKLTLTADHQGSDGFGDTITWTATGKIITMKLSNSGSGTPATYTGVATTSGIARKAKPGALKLSSGDTGGWYAKLLPPPPA